MALIAIDPDGHGARGAAPSAGGCASDRRRSVTFAEARSAHAALCPLAPFDLSGGFRAGRLAPVRCARTRVDAILVAATAARRRSYARVLEQQGYTVCAVATIGAAIRRAVTDRVSVAFVPFTADAGGRMLRRLRDELHPLVDLGVSVMLLGRGWERRLSDAVARPSVPAAGGVTWVRDAVICAE